MADETKNEKENLYAVFRLITPMLITAFAVILWSQIGDIKTSTTHTADAVNALAVQLATVSAKTQSLEERLNNDESRSNVQKGNH